MREFIVLPKSVVNKKERNIIMSDYIVRAMAANAQIRAFAVKSKNR